MKKIFLFLLCSVILSGCADLRQEVCGREKIPEPVVVFPSFGSNYLLSCLNDTGALNRKEFNVKYMTAHANLSRNKDLDKLYFICLSLHEKADYKQFKHGKKVLEKYLEDQPDSGDNMAGFLVLVDRLDEEIMTRWSAWKSLLNDKKELTAEVKSLQVKLEEQQKKIEQLKNIENIIKNRETGK